jgi:DNA replication protein DnaC
MDKTSDKFKQLRLKHCALNLKKVLEEAEQKNLSCRQTIERLLDLELEQRHQARISLRFRQSKLAEKLTIDQFHFRHHSSREKQQQVIRSLLDLEFINQRKDIILIGNPGVGKSYLAKCIAYAATQAGISTLFTSAMEMLNHLIAAEADHSLLKKLKYYEAPDLLVCDELCKALHNSSYDKLNVM